jgi:hypothetical protein
VSDYQVDPEANPFIGFIGRLALSAVLVTILYVLSSTFLVRLSALPRQVGLGLFAGISLTVALIGLLTVGKTPLRPVAGTILALAVLLLRIFLTLHPTTAAQGLADSGLALLFAFFVGTSLSSALPNGLWGLRACIVGGAFQLQYYLLGYGPGALGIFAFAPAVPKSVQGAWGLDPVELLGHGAQALDLIFIAMIVSLGIRGLLKPRASIFAIITSATAVGILTTATNKPAPAMPWLAAILYLYQTVEEAPLPPIKRRTAPPDPADAAG